MQPGGELGGQPAELAGGASGHGASRRLADSERHRGLPRSAVTVKADDRAGMLGAERHTGPDRELNVDGPKKAGPRGGDL